MKKCIDILNFEFEFRKKKKNLKKYKIKTIDDVYNSKKFMVSFSPKLIKANNQIREFLKLI